MCNRHIWKLQRVTSFYWTLYLAHDWLCFQSRNDEHKIDSVWMLPEKHISLISFLA